MIESDIIKDIRALILADVASVGIYDKWAHPDDALPYVVFGATQRVRNHAKEGRFSIYYVTLHLWNRDAIGSIATRNLAEEIIDAVDNKKLSNANLDCYFVDNIVMPDSEDESINHFVMSFECR